MAIPGLRQAGLFASIFALIIVSSGALASIAIDPETSGSDSTSTLAVGAPNKEQLSPPAITPPDLAKYTPSTTINYYAGGKKVAEKKDSALHYVHEDNLGSVALLTDAAGGEMQNSRAQYEAFGASSSEKGRFTGKQKDAGTGLLYYGARYYDPSLGRFTSADSVAGAASDPQTLNRYSYVSNNPLKYVDPDGRQQQPASSNNFEVVRVDTAGVDTFYIPPESLEVVTRRLFGGHGTAYQQGRKGNLDDYFKWLSAGKGPGGSQIIQLNKKSRIAGGIYLPPVTQKGTNEFVAPATIALRVNMDPDSVLGKAYNRFMIDYSITKGMSEMDLLKNVNDFLQRKVTYSLESELERIRAVSSSYMDLGEFMFATEIDGQKVPRGVACGAMSLAASAFIEKLCDEGYLQGTVIPAGSDDHAVAVYEDKTGNLIRIDPSYNYVGSAGP